MTGEKLQEARKYLGLTQVEAAQKLGVSQSYLSLLEQGRRKVTPKLAKRSVALFDLPPTALPVETELKNVRPVSNRDLVKDLAALNYPGYSHIRSSRRKNPTQVLLSALSSKNLEARLVEALPWLMLNFSDMEWQCLVDAAKLKNLQNRLGFLTTLARKLAEKLRDTKKAAVFKRRERSLADSRLLKEDTLCRAMTEAEKRWLMHNRTPDAEFWNVLSDLSVEQLSYVK